MVFKMPTNKFNPNNIGTKDRLIQTNEFAHKWQIPYFADK
jgi:hypothetical protein